MDYLIVEAVHLKVAREDRKMHEEAEKEAEMKRKKKEAQEELQKMFPAKSR